MGDWRIIHQESSVVDDLINQIGSLGHLDGYITFTIENTETGSIRKVTAYDADEIGQRIADGEFDDDDDEYDDD
jgi:hypothetical protein